jgi:hypothetical protein
MIYKVYTKRNHVLNYPVVASVKTKQIYDQRRNQKINVGAYKK